MLSLCCDRGLEEFVLNSHPMPVLGLPILTTVQKATISLLGFTSAHFLGCRTHCIGVAVAQGRKLCSSGVCRSHFGPCVGCYDFKGPLFDFEVRCVVSMFC